MTGQQTVSMIEQNSGSDASGCSLRADFATHLTPETNCLEPVFVMWHSFGQWIAILKLHEFLVDRCSEKPV